MKVSIITVCKNSAATIRETIESVASQGYADVEYIVIDGASTDGTQAIVSEYGEVVAKFISEPDHGIYHAMNKGVALASGDIIAFLNSDDCYCRADVISAVVEKFRSSGAGIVFGELIYISPARPDRVLRHFHAKNFAPWQFRFGFMPPHPATFVHSDVYKEVGGFDETYKIASDFDFMVRALYLHRMKYQIVRSVLVAMKVGGISTKGWRSSWCLNKEIVRACNARGLKTCLPLLALKVPFRLRELIRPRSADGGE